MAAPPGTALLSPRQLEERARRWRPWRSYATMHLWRAAGDLPAPAGRRAAPERAAAAQPGA
jgi:3-methyladenine DNA glycosylase/8-oxoguanine DNA glycosylase